MWVGGKALKEFATAVNDCGGTQNVESRWASRAGREGQKGQRFHQALSLWGEGFCACRGTATSALERIFLGVAHYVSTGQSCDFAAFSLCLPAGLPLAASDACCDLLAVCLKPSWDLVLLWSPAGAGECFLRGKKVGREGVKSHKGD